MKLLKKLRKRWQQWRFQQQKPTVASRRGVIQQAIAQGKLQRFKES